LIQTSELFFYKSIFFDRIVKEVNMDITFLYEKGVLCLIRFKVSHVSNSKENIFEISINPEDLRQTFSEFDSQQDLPQAHIPFDLNCSAGYLFDEYKLSCSPCPRNTFSDNISIFELEVDCIVCSDKENHFCYGANKRLPKPGCFKSNFFSTKFLMCPNKKSYLKDIEFRVALMGFFLNRDCRAALKKQEFLESLEGAIFFVTRSLFVSGQFSLKFLTRILEKDRRLNL
jgi:hypothetical protein